MVFPAVNPLIGAITNRSFREVRKETILWIFYMLLGFALAFLDVELLAIHSFELF
jgi:hypothetical protein